MEFEIGDVVQLKSGGPVMTVYNVDGSSIGCIWFDDKNKKISAPFIPETLQKYEE